MSAVIADAKHLPNQGADALQRPHLAPVPMRQRPFPQLHLQLLQLLRREAALPPRRRRLAERLRASFPPGVVPAAHAAGFHPESPAHFRLRQSLRKERRGLQSPRFQLLIVNALPLGECHAAVCHIPK